MASHHVLLLGGNGKVAQLLTPMLLQRSWNVTSIIRNPDQVPHLQKLAENQPGKLSVLVRSIEDVKSDTQAKSLIDEVRPDYVVWSAGAGGKGAPERTYAIDRDAAIHFIRASVATPSITKFIMVSFFLSRLSKPSWWTEDDWTQQLGLIKKHLGRYYEAKVAADQVLYEESKKRKDFAAICLRPGTLTEEPVGKVALGRLPVASGSVSRASVANVTALLLENQKTRSCWLDMLDGDEDPEAAVNRCVDEGVDAIEGEPFYP
ncbi:NAD dependent epimerase/dehydratase [Xylariomycetidae sp. FL2044]|nr:NAD dependent epimerase/dehydratase [Xylariomycetidae sp. FL2044]